LHIETRYFLRSNAIEWQTLPLAFPTRDHGKSIKQHDLNGAENHMRPKTATASFRLDESALNAIQEDARKQNVSVNTLLNQLVLAYANYDLSLIHI